MQNRILPLMLIGLLAVAATLLPARSAEAMTAEQYFADGNRLYREDLYWAALLRYSQASEAGMNTALLHYNTGIAHYRAGQHIRARASLLKAVDDPSLRVVAQYNLGLNAFSLGEYDEALGWFRLVRDQQDAVLAAQDPLDVDHPAADHDVEHVPPAVLVGALQGHVADVVGVDPASDRQLHRGLGVGQVLRVVRRVVVDPVLEPALVQAGAGDDLRYDYRCQWPHTVGTDRRCFLELRETRKARLYRSQLCIGSE